MNDEWMQFYEENNINENQVSSFEYFDTATVTTTSTIVIDNSILSSNSPCTVSTDQLSPKGSVSKPVRRRLRASKKKPTTLLNANTANFRDLVQQFTGCPKPISLGASRAPININFAKAGKDINQGSMEGFSNNAMHPFDDNFYGGVSLVGSGYYGQRGNNMEIIQDVFVGGSGNGSFHEPRQENFYPNESWNEGYSMG